MAYDRKKYLAYARANRNAPTGGEAELRRLLLEANIGRVRRQYVVGRLIVDLAIPDRNLIVEIDGDSHREKGGQDERRDAWLRGLGFNVLRVSNEEVLQRGAKVVESVLRFPSGAGNASRFHTAVRTAQFQSKAGTGEGGDEIPPTP